MYIQKIIGKLVRQITGACIEKNQDSSYGKYRWRCMHPGWGMGGGLGFSTQAPVVILDLVNGK